MSFGLSKGSKSNSTDTAPATNGVAMEVPENHQWEQLIIYQPPEQL